MFTGIIQAMGKVREPEKLGDGVRLTIDAPTWVLKM
jgi:riboflavin synthase